MKRNAPRSDRSEKYARSGHLARLTREMITAEELDREAEYFWGSREEAMAAISRRVILRYREEGQ
jgi:hypothetical protein